MFLHKTTGQMTRSTVDHHIDHHIDHLGSNLYRYDI